MAPDIETLNAANANFGTQNFYGTVYIIADRPPKPEDPPKTRVFLSYARSDDGDDYDDPAKSLLRRLTNDLTAAEFAVWWDRISLPSRGLSFNAEIEKAIHDSERFVLVAGPGAVASDYVRAELACALEACKPVTVILRAGDFNVIPAGVSAVNAIDFRANKRDYAASLADLIARLRQPAPIGQPVYVPALPKGHVRRATAFDAAHAALMADAIRPTVVSAPPRAAAIFGVGGIGKSTLAAALAHDCIIRRKFSDGVIWTEIGQTPDIQTRLADVGVALGDPRALYVGEGTDAQSAAAALNRTLHDKQALIILDNVWDDDVLKYFRVGGTPCRLLITTRKADIARRVDGVDVRVDLLTSAEGAALIAGRAGGSPDDATYLDISRTLGGHTLAIRLAADQLTNHYADNAADLLRLLTKQDNPLAHLKLKDDDKDENVERSLWVSYSALSGDLQRRFRATGIFALESTFDRAALAAVWGDADPDDARAALGALHDVGLLDESETPGRYSQHRLIHAYATALLEQLDGTQAVFLRYSDWVVAKAHMYSEQTFESWYSDPFVAHMIEVGDRLVDCYRTTMTEKIAILALTMRGYFYIRSDQLRRLKNGLQENRIAMFEIAIDYFRSIHHHERLLSMLFSMGKILDNLGRPAEALATLEQCLLVATKFDSQRDIAAVQGGIANLYVRQGHWEEALNLYQKSLEIFQVLNDSREIAVNQVAIADLYFHQGQWEEALNLYQKSLETFQVLNDSREIAATKAKMAEVNIDRGKTEEGLALYEEALYAFQYLMLSLDISITQKRIADLYVMQGRWEEALSLYVESLGVFQSLDNPRETANTRSAIADLYVMQGRWEEALDLYQQSLISLQSVDDKREIAATQGAIAGLYEQMGRWKEALDLHEDALKITRALEDRKSIAIVQSDIADLYVQIGRWKEGLDLYEESLQSFQDLGFTRGIASTLTRIADLYTAIGRWEEAHELFSQARGIFQSLNATFSSTITMGKVARLYVHMGRWDAAEQLFDEALNTLQLLNAPREIAENQRQIAGLYVQTGRWKEALRLYEDSLEVMRLINDPNGVATVQGDIAYVYMQIGQSTQALELYKQVLEVVTKSNNTLAIANTKSAMADVLVNMGYWSKALELYMDTLEVARTLEFPREIAVSQSKIAYLYSRMGRVEEAIALYKEALISLRIINDPREIAYNMSAIAELYVQVGGWKEAIDSYEGSLLLSKNLNEMRGIAVTQLALGQLLILTNHDLGRALSLLWESCLIIERFENSQEITRSHRILQSVKHKLGPERFASIWNETIPASQPAWLK